MSPELAEDAVQEAGLRALHRGLDYRDASDLRRWVRVVAWRLVIDGWRRDARHATEETSDRSSAIDVEELVGDRLVVAAALDAYQRLSPADRAALTAVAAPGDRQTQVRTAVRKHRARARLLALMEGAAAVVVFLVRRGKTATVTTLAVATISVVVLVVREPGSSPTLGTRADDATSLRGGAVADVVGVAAAPVSTTDPLPPGGADAVEAREHFRPRIIEDDGSDRMLHAEWPDLGSGEAQTYVHPKEPDEPIVCAWVVPAGTKVCTPPTPAPPDPRDLVEPPAL